MTARNPWSVAQRQLLDKTLAELLAVGDRGSVFDSAIIAAVEGAALLATAAEEADRPGSEEEAVELARQSLGAMRASVVATTVSVRALADRLRSVGRPGGNDRRAHVIDTSAGHPRVEAVGPM
jgi:hypothetical protein